MDSSTSSSESPALVLPWQRIWLLALGLGLTALFALEGGWRLAGQRASVTDDNDLWAHERSRAGRDPRTLVALGFSRIRTNLVPSVVREAHPDYRVVQLAVNARHPLAALEDLSRDENFRGTVLCSLVEISFTPELADDQDEKVEHYQRTPRLVQLQRAAMARLEERFVLLNEHLRAVPALSGWLRDGALPRIASGVVHADRSVSRSLPDRLRVPSQRRVLAAEARLYAMTKLPAPEEWLRQVARIEPWVERIRSRGGQVVLLRIPVAPPLYAVDKARFPKALYWDRIAEATSAEAIHFVDVPGMLSFDFPDYSHLNEAEARRFTVLLVQELERRGLLPPRG